MQKKKLSSPTRRPVPVNRVAPDFTAVTDKIKPVQSLGLVLAALFYGRAGTGKTTVAATFPKPLLILDIREKGTDSVSEVEGVDVIQVTDWAEFESIYWYLVSPQNKYKTVVIDAVSQLQDFAVESIVAEGGRSDGLVSKAQWGKAAGILKTWMINYRDLVDQNLNVVFLAHDRVHEGDESEDGEMMPSVGPRVMPSVASILTAGVKLIGNTYIRENVQRLASGKMKKSYNYCMRIGPHSYYETKVRLNKGGYVPETLVDPDYNSLISLMKGELTPTPAPKLEPRKILRKGK